MLDLILIVIVAAFAVSGYRQGFIVGVLSFLGFVGGALLGAEFGPAISRALVGGQTQQDIIAVVLLVELRRDRAVHRLLHRRRHAVHGDLALGDRRSTRWAARWSAWSRCC